MASFGGIQPDALHAYAASNLANELYNGSYGAYIKFSTPTIANGKVYVGTENSVAVFGLLNSPAIGAILNSAGNKAGRRRTGIHRLVYGTNLAAGSVTASENPLPRVLAGARVLINGLLAPLLSACPTQINAQVPYGFQLELRRLWRSMEAACPHRSLFKFRRQRLEFSPCSTRMEPSTDRPMHFAWKHSFWCS